MQAELVRRAQQGDEAAFAALVPPAAERLLAVAYRILRDAQLAEDATQQALLVAWRKIRTLRDAERFDAWTYRLVINACYAETRQRPHVLPLRLLVNDAATLDRTEQSNDRDQLERGFRQLTAAHRAIVVLHLYVGLPFDEIAEILDVPIGTARSRMHYALRALREALGSDDAPVSSDTSASRRGTA